MNYLDTIDKYTKLQTGLNYWKQQRAFLGNTKYKQEDITSSIASIEKDLNELEEEYKRARSCIENEHNLLSILKDCLKVREFSQLEGLMKKTNYVLDAKKELTKDSYIMLKKWLEE